MSVRLVGDWRRARRTLEGSAQKLRRGMEGAVREQAQRAKREVVQGIRRQAPGGEQLDRPSPLTLASRKLEGVRGQKALQATGELVRAVTYIARGLEAFVGIPSSARGSDGRPLSRVAEVQEDGSGPIVIPMTPAMRRYLGALRSKANAEAPNRTGGGPGVIVVTVPPRPFLRPAFNAAVRGARQRLREHIARRFGLL